MPGPTSGDSDCLYLSLLRRVKADTALHIGRGRLGGSLPGEDGVLPQNQEHIAREMRIRTTEESVDLRGSAGMAEYLNIGRG